MWAGMHPQPPRRSLVHRRTTERRCMDEIWSALAEHRKEKKAHRRSLAPRAIDVLHASGLKYKVRNEGEHYIIAGRIDWWPSSGVWIARKTNKRGVGIHSALKWLEQNA